MPAARAHNAANAAIHAMSIFFPSSDSKPEVSSAARKNGEEKKGGAVKKA
jgi:hypothetical protein